MVRERAGFSTVGAIVALILLGLVMAPLLGTVLGAQKGFVNSRARARVTGNIRYAHLALTRMLRMAGSNPMGGAIQGIEPDPLGSGEFNAIRLRSDYNPPDGDTGDSGEDVTFYVRSDTMYVLWGTGASEEPYLVGVDSLAFEYFDREGAPIVDPDLVAAEAAAAQLTIRARGAAHDGQVERLLVGRVKLRNGR